MVDLKITGGDANKEDKIDMNSEAYLKELIKLSSKGRAPVSTHAKGLQFFIVKGGAEGFLEESYKGRDASHQVEGGGVTTSGEPGTVMTFSYTDLIAAFDAHGNLVSSALLGRPLSIQNPNRWSEHAAQAVYDSWDGQPVSIYYSKRPHWVPYYGLWVDDRRGYYRNKVYQVDLHKEEATNGCIFILDPNTPPYSDKDNSALNNFEPKFIKDVQKSIGANIKTHIGTMHMVDIE